MGNEAGTKAKLMAYKVFTEAQPYLISRIILWILIQHKMEEKE